MFTIQLPRRAGGCFKGFQCGSWTSFHIDDLHNNIEIDITELQNKPISEIFESSDIQQARPQNAASPEETLQQPTPGIDTLEIIRNCLPQAISRLRYELGHLDRTPKLNRHFGALLETTQGPLQQTTSKLLHVIRLRIAELMREQEVNEPRHLRSENWLQQAARPSAVLENATLSQSILQHLKQLATPLLAGLLAFCDTNNNLDVISGIDDKTLWVLELWTDMLRNKDFILNNYQTLAGEVSFTEYFNQNRVECRVQYLWCTRDSLRFTRSRMPFSFLYISLIDRILAVQLPMPLAPSQDTTESTRYRSPPSIQVSDPLEELRRKVQTTALQLFSALAGQLLVQDKWLLYFDSNSDVEGIAERYLHDYIMSVYPASSEQELEVKILFLSLNSFLLIFFLYLSLVWRFPNESSWLQ